MPELPRDCWILAIEHQSETEIAIVMSGGCIYRTEVFSLCRDLEDIRPTK